VKKLYLIPTPISENTDTIPKESIQIIAENKIFICERIRTIRRFIKSVLKDFDIDGARFIELDKNGQINQNTDIIEIIQSGMKCCFMSEAGSPCIADPGAELVNLARRHHYQIIPLSGPSSIIQALMASGMNGQLFTFHGYLPVKNQQLNKQLKIIEKSARSVGSSHLFIETPYRNVQMFDSILNTVDERLRLHIAYSISSDKAYSDTKTIKNWKKDDKIQEILKAKNPCIFIIGR